MAGICGWLGGSRHEESDARLGTMARALDGARPEARVLDAAALAAAPAPGQHHCLHESARVLVAWVGRIRWQDANQRDRAREHGDGPAIARAYTETGPAFLDALDGEFALALFDRHENELVLAVDRVGVRSLTYCTTASGVVFASAARALGAHPDAPRAVDPQGVYDFVYFHMIPSPRSIFRGWHKLRPGEYVIARGTAAEHRRYWIPTYVDDSAVSERELADEYRRTVRRAVQSCIDSSHGRVGAFLSGGTDSSTVAGLIGELTGEPAHTYSIGFDVPGYDESSYARIAVRHFGTRHHEYTVTPDDVARAAPRIAREYDEPFGNASAVASLYCAELAKRDGIDTLFGGDGGDEIFAGNERYARQRVFERYYRIPSWMRTSVVEPLVAALPGNGFPIGKAKSYVGQARVPLPERLESYNFLSRMAPGDVFDPDFLAAVEPAEPVALLRERYHETPSTSMLHRLLYLDLKFTLADNDLRKVGRTCAMAGVDVRYPFLDADLVAFANRVPPELKLKGQHLRYFFKRASKGFLPPEILAKPKHGFGVPCGRWMRDHEPLREMAHDSLSSLVNRGYLSGAFTERLKKLHQGEHANYYGVMVWVLTMLELWHQHHAE